MDFFENQVGEVRYLSTLSDPATAAPVVSPLTRVNSSSLTAAATVANTAVNKDRESLSVTAASPSNKRTPPSASVQQTQPSRVNTKPDKKSKKPAPAAPRGDTMPSFGFPSSAPTNASVAGAKRKSHGDDADNDDNDDESPNVLRPAPQQRSKRNRYISIACNECKRRKIKCNGETPCGRCGHLNLQCLYAPNCCATSVKDSDDFKQMAAQVNHLQEQVETLFNNLNALRAETLRTGPPYQHDRALTGPSTSSTPSSTTMTLPPPPPPRQPPFAFRGPTSNHFTLDVAKNTLHKMGYSYPSDNGEANGPAHETPVASPKLAPRIIPSVENPTTDPLWELDKDEMIRLCRIYQEEVGIMYPVLRIETIIAHAKTLSAWMETARKNGFPSGQDRIVDDTNTLQLKVVLCGGLLVDGHGNSVQAQRIFAGIEHIANRMLMSDPPNVQTLPFLALVAGYHFLSADEVLCWRVMGQVVRLCLELGLHRREVVEQIKDEEERKGAIHTFWSVYVLDRRWAFSAGLPYVVADEEIDPDLPPPDQYPFLAMMTKYTKLSGRVWRSVRQFGSNVTMDTPVDDIEDLDRLIKKWYNDLPKDVQLGLSDWEELPPYLSPPVNFQKEYDMQRLKIWTWLRYNQIRMWLHTPILHTHSSIMDNLSHAEVAVKLAKNTIRYLTHLNNTTNVYRKMQIFYHQFLSSAITILFVASCHAPVNFSSSCRDEFYLALELLKDMSAKSWISKRLWGMVKSLRDVAPRLGLAEDPPSSGFTMAGLATSHNPTGPGPSASSSFGPPPIFPSSPGFDATQNGVQMSSEMSRIFEGVSVKLGQLHDSLGPAEQGIIGSAVSSVAPAMSFGPPRGVMYPPFRDLF
ncbi:fungal-specific transcription factor domain-containing protein [Xylaria intraflava]|nr:fungal-specific transcription factor domain-containing protein [Xylaria intraflava]